MAGSVVGRDDLVGGAAAELHAGRSVLFVGVAGVGKTTVLLSGRPAETDSQLPYVTLIDLLASVPEALFDRLSAPARRERERKT